MIDIVGVGFTLDEASKVFCAMVFINLHLFTTKEIIKTIKRPFAAKITGLGGFGCNSSKIWFTNNNRFNISSIWLKLLFRPTNTTQHTIYRW